MIREQTFLAALAAAAAVALAGCGGGGEGGNGPPTQPVNEPPDVTITNPPTGSSFQEGQTVPFEGTATDPEQGSLGGQDLVWRSDLDGRLGTGIAVNASRLSAGDHRITLEATDGQGATGADSISIAVVSDAPADQAELRPSGFAVLPGGALTGQDVEIAGRVVNAGGVDAGPFDWRITLDGTVVASGRIQGLPARDSAELPRQDLGSFGTRGTHTARIEVDTGDEVDEASDADNVAEDLLAVYPTGMDVELEFVTAVADSTRDIFDQTARRWERIVPGDLVDAAVDSFDVSQCIDGGPVLQNDTIDDLRIFVRVDSIDGSGGVLGQAGPCGIRQNPAATVAVGAMEFDEADVENLQANGRLQATVLHEIAHVLGFGTLWLDRGLVTDTASNEPAFRGRQAREAFVEVGGDAFGGNPVPVEGLLGGQGTRLGHWSEQDLQDELMTGFIQSGADPFSIVSVASMGDLKYANDPAEADPYTFPAARDGALRSGTASPWSWERALEAPLFSIDPATGRVERIRPVRRP